MDISFPRGLCTTHACGRPKPMLIVPGTKDLPFPRTIYKLAIHKLFLGNPFCEVFRLLRSFLCIYVCENFLKSSKLIIILYCSDIEPDECRAEVGDFECIIFMCFFRHTTAVEPPTCFEHI